MMIPVTEESNPLTVNIDTSSPREIVSLLNKADQEIVGGWKDYMKITDSLVLQAMVQVANLAADIIMTKVPGKIILSGCGTSGRIAFMVARSFNERLREMKLAECLSYLIAGGDRSLFTSQEALEDDPHHGVSTLKQVVCDVKGPVLYIGITCGLSAPFVAAQLDYCMNHLPQSVPVLLGFNPISQARNVPIALWDKTCLSVAKNLEDKSHHGKSYIINPVLGPETITGSSRMKGGTATKIILETIFTIAYHKVQQTHQPIDPLSMIKAYENNVLEVTYSKGEEIAVVIDKAGASLRSGGHIYYLSMGSLGIVAMIDASECVPTYGADINDVRGFIDTGYDLLRNKEGDLSSQGECYQISVSHFETDILPSVCNKDIVIVLLSSLHQNHKRCKTIMETCQTKGVFTVCVSYNMSQFDHKCDVDIDFCIPDCNEISPRYDELSAKVVCNAISTGAHVLAGKVYNNHMIDVQVRNSKLYHRAISIIETITNRGLEDSENALLCSIYHVDHVEQSHLVGKTIQDHITMATTKDKIVPMAIVMLLRKCSIQEARDYLLKQPILRRCLREMTS